MTSESEARFRDAERQLDDALRRDREAIVSGGIEVFDDSRRLCHYKNESLSWSLRFEARRSRGSAVEKVWGLLSVSERDPTVVTLFRRAEVFEIGQSPRWQKTDERTVSLQALLWIGLGTTIAQEVEEGRAE